MAEQTLKQTEAPAGGPEYDKWFSTTPDPWSQLATLEPGEDRTYATTVQSMVLNAEPAQRAQMEARLLKVLQNENVTATGQMFVCRMLALIGTAAAVPAMAKLLERTETADAARYALDGIPVSQVDEAYRHALGRLQGTAKVGLISSIALRGDWGAVPLLQAIAQNPAEPKDVVEAAQRAVARLTPKR